MNAHQELILKALHSFRGDNLYRAQVAFSRCTPDEMSRPYGDSGQTRQQIIDGYQAHESAVDAAIQWVVGLS